MKIQTVLYVVIAALAMITGILGGIVHDQSKRLSQKDERLAEARQTEDNLRQQLEREHKIIEAAAHRLDAALSNFMEGVSHAHKDHESRMEAVSQSESVDWLCEPVPDDIRLLFGCADTEDGDRRADDKPQTAGGADAALH